MTIAACTLLTAGALTAATPVGLSTVGNVWTNQVALPSGSRVAAGDVIETDATGLAILASDELGRVEVRASSKAALESGRVALRQGSVASDRMPVRVGEFEVAPANGARAWFVVAERGGQPWVGAHEGDVVIRRAGQADLVVPAGHYAMAAAAPPPQATSKADAEEEDDDEAAAGERRRRTTAGSGRAKKAGSSGGGFTIGPLGPTASIAVVGAATAAGLSGFALAAQDDNPVSPE